MAGPLASLLMGVGNRAAEVSRRDEERAYRESSQGRQLANEALMKMLEDPSRTYEDQQRIASQIEDINKMKKGSLQQAFHAATQLHPHIEKALAAQPMPPIPEMVAQKQYEVPATTSMTAEPPVTIRGGALAGQQAPAVMEPNVQMRSFQSPQLAPMPPAPAGLNPQGQAGMGAVPRMPGSELERVQMARTQALQQHLQDLKAMGATPEMINDAMRAGIGISPAERVAQIRAGSARDVALIGAQSRLAAGNKGRAIAYQAPGGMPRTLFEVTSGPQAGKLFHNGEEVQLEPGEKPIHSFPDKIEAIQDPDTKEITYHNVTAELGGKPSVNIGKGQRLGAGASANAGELTPEGLDAAAELFAKTGVMPAMGMGAAGVRTQIINRAAELHPKVDLGSNKASYTANQASLTQMQKNRDAVITFENTALKNLDIFQKTAKPLIDSGSPLLNYPIRIAAQKASGSVEVAAFNAARTVALTEIAKVLNNPNLTGQLTNEARAEAMAVSPDTATLKQIYAVVDILKQDMKNRHDELDATVEAIKDRISGGGTGEKKAAAGPSLKKPPMPPIGTIRNGYRRVKDPGTNPGDWVKVKEGESE